METGGFEYIFAKIVTPIIFSYIVLRIWRTYIDVSYLAKLHFKPNN